MSAGKPMADAASTLTELRVSLSRLCTGSEVSAVAEQKHTPSGDAHGNRERSQQDQPS